MGLSLSRGRKQPRVSRVELGAELDADLKLEGFLSWCLAFAVGEDLASPWDPALPLPSSPPGNLSPALIGSCDSSANELAAPLAASSPHVHVQLPIQARRGKARLVGRIHSLRPRCEGSTAHAKASRDRHCFALALAAWWMKRVEGRAWRSSRVPRFSARENHIDHRGMGVGCARRDVRNGQARPEPGVVRQAYE